MKRSHLPVLLPSVHTPLGAVNAFSVYQKLAVKSGTGETRRTASAHGELVLLGLLLAFDVVELFW